VGESIYSGRTEINWPLTGRKRGERERETEKKKKKKRYHWGSSPSGPASLRP
jgi:hypothetical protein